MRSISILDTSVSTNNIGDEIIMDAVNGVVEELFPDAYVTRIASHEFIGAYSRKLIEKSDFSLLGGTNALDSKMLGKHALWKLRMSDASWLRSVVLLGVGWRGYRGDLDFLTKRTLNKVLSDKHIHSVRDGYSKAKLGVVDRKVANTTCMTMWGLDDEHCRKLGTARAGAVITTLTFYKPDPASDVAMLNALKRAYPTVWFWPQQQQDFAYFNSLGVEGIKIVRPTLKAYNEILENEDVDFVGTRLHGGVRAMQKGHRALIASVDNRATEIAKDTNLPVIKRGDTDAVLKWLEERPEVSLTLPWQAIQDWKGQFK